MPPLWLVLQVVLLGGAAAYIAAAYGAVKPQTSLAPPSTYVVAVRWAFVANIVFTMIWSFITLSDVVLCNDSGDRCFTFSGWAQFTSFTRWCWILQGVYFVSANLGLRCARVLFSVSLSSALLVTSFVYLVLIPGALLRPQPGHKAGNVALLVSTQAHIMHLCNTLQLLWDLWFAKTYTAQLSDAQYSIAWGLMYVVFEWIFHHYSGMWHYPFLDFTKPFSSLSYTGVLCTSVATCAAASKLCSVALVPRGKDQ
ncbi:hypothetical protein AB1Y20_017594 [Prymnesium parvum]|uniref:Very-long-chain 3-oxoacyl-CoA synthase n=1 Tax=Prymnesium parvum TaxID=97485 RepID=A0AB34JMM4_PRYPA